MIVRNADYFIADAELQYQWYAEHAGFDVFSTDCSRRSRFARRCARMRSVAPFAVALSPYEMLTEQFAAAPLGASIIGRRFRSRLSLDARNQTEAVHQWQDAKNTEGAIHQTPIKWNPANRAADQSQWDDARARGDSGVNRRSPGSRIHERTDEEDGDHNVTEREPVSAVGDPRVLCVCLIETVSNRENPEGQSAIAVRALGCSYPQRACEKIQFQKVEERL